MSELIDVLEECIEIVVEEEYPIDKVIMSEERTNTYINELQGFLDNFLLRIKIEFPDFDKFIYRRIIFPYKIIPDENGMVTHDGEEWELMKCSEYEHGGYEVYLRREK